MQWCSNTPRGCVLFTWYEFSFTSPRTQTGNHMEGSSDAFKRPHYRRNLCLFCSALRTLLQQIPHTHTNEIPLVDFLICCTNMLFPLYQAAFNQCKTAPYWSLSVITTISPCSSKSQWAISVCAAAESLTVWFIRHAWGHDSSIHLMIVQPCWQRVCKCVIWALKVECLS